MQNDVRWNLISKVSMVGLIRDAAKRLGGVWEQKLPSCFNYEFARQVKKWEDIVLPLVNSGFVSLFSDNAAREQASHNIQAMQCLDHYIEISMLNLRIEDINK